MELLSYQKTGLTLEIITSSIEVKKHGQTTRMSKSSSCLQGELIHHISPQK